MPRKQQGVKVVAQCLEDYGPAYRKRAVHRYGTLWCRSCGYQVDLHDKLAQAKVVADSAPPLRPRT